MSNALFGSRWNRRKGRATIPPSTLLGTGWSPRGCVARMISASRNTAVRNDRPPVVRVLTAKLSTPTQSSAYRSASQEAAEDPDGVAYHPASARSVASNVGYLIEDA